MSNLVDVGCTSTVIPTTSPPPPSLPDEFGPQLCGIGMEFYAPLSTSH